MPEHRYFPKSNTRQIIDFNHILSELNNEVILCLSPALLAIIRKLLVERGLWRTTYTLGYDDTGYFIPTDEEFEPVKQAILTFLEETSEMSNCGELIKEGLQAIASAMASKTCCGGAPGSINTPGIGGVGTTTTPGTTSNTGTPGDHTGDPPDGFASWEAYDTYKCSVATWIVQSLKDDFQRVSIIQFVSGSGLAVIAGLLAAGLLVPIAGEVLLVVAGVVSSALALGVLSEVWSLIYTAIVNKESELVCALFTAGNFDDAQSAFSGILLDEVESLGEGVSVAFAQSIVNSYVTGDLLNRLFDKDTSRAFPEGDCGDCIQQQYPLQYIQDLGTGNLDLDDTTRTITSVWDGAEQQIYIALDIPEGGGCSPFTIQFMSDTQSLVFDCRDCANGSTAGGHRALTTSDTFAGLFSIQMYAVDPPANNSGTTFSISVKLRYT